MEPPLFSLRLEILPPAQRSLWNDLGMIPRTFVLYGGTALALRLGHRQSVDFDFFTNDSFEPTALLSHIAFLHGGRVDQRGNNTLTVVVDRGGEVKVSFFGDVAMNHVNDPELIRDPEVRIASLLDLTATKLKTIQQRAEAKDYLDVFAAIEQGIALPAALSAATAIYGRTFNAMAALKALSYFADGDLPFLKAEVKQTLREAAQSVSLDSLPETQAKPGILSRQLG